MLRAGFSFHFITILLQHTLLLFTHQRSQYEDSEPVHSFPTNRQSHNRLRHGIRNPQNQQRPNMHGSRPAHTKWNPNKYILVSNHKHLLLFKVLPEIHPNRPIHNVFISTWPGTSFHFISN